MRLSTTRLAKEMVAISLGNISVTIPYRLRFKRPIPAGAISSLESRRRLYAIQVTANAAGIIRACEPVNQSTAVDYLTAPGNPGHLFVCS